MLRENQREALKEINARTQPLSLDHLDVSCAILADAILSLEAATAYAEEGKMDETAWVELRTLSEKEMIPAIHYNLLASILRRLDKIEAATAYARPQWETLVVTATAPVSSASSALTTGESGTAESPSESSTDRAESAPTVKVEEIP